jgi:hypothetical protein
VDLGIAVAGKQRQLNTEDSTMRQFTSLLWKEWRETRIFLWIGLGIFLGLPCIGGVEDLYQSAHRFDIPAAPWVFMFGGVFALFVAVATTCRDLVPGIEEFWRSRPVSVVRWFLVKYTVGLAVSVSVCLVPLLAERMLESQPADLPPSALVWLSLLWAALYSMAFAAGCLVRRPAHAAMLALAGLLLIYFLPLAAPPLRAMNALDIVEVAREPGPMFRALMFAVGMSAVAVVMLALAIAAVRYRWRIDAGRRLMYGAVGTALVIIFATVGYQIGTNLPVLQEAGISKVETVANIRCDGHRGSVVTIEYIGWGLQQRALIRVRSLELTPAGIRLGEPKQITNRAAASHWYWAQAPTPQASVPGHPEIFYSTDLESDEPESPIVHCKLVLLRVDLTTAIAERSTVKLWAADQSTEPFFPRIQVWGDRLFVMGSQLATLDITNPLVPHLVSCAPLRFNPIGSHDATTFSLQLPRVPGLPNQQRLAAATQTWGWWYFPDEGVLCESRYVGDAGESTSMIIAWRLQKLTDESAMFQPIGQWQDTILLALFGSSSVHDMAMHDGLLYVVPWPNPSANNPVTVFDLRGPHPMQPIGHFGAPGIGAVCLLPDGRALIGGNQLWLVGPPPTRR